MARTAEQVLREMVAEYIFQTARLIAEVERLTEDTQRLTLKAEEKTKDTNVTTA